MIFVDRRMSKIENMSMSRMFADSPLELDAMAARLGLDPTWKLQAGTPVEHYLLTSGKRMIAVRNGAVLMSTEDVIERVRRRERGEPEPAGGTEWEPVRQAFAEMAELTTALEGSVATAGIHEAVRLWVNGMRRVVARIANERGIYAPSHRSPHN